MGYSPPTLYIRSYPVQDRGYTNFLERRLREVRRIYLLGTRAEFFDDAAPAETQAHRSNGPYQMIGLRHLLCPATIRSTPTQGTRPWDTILLLTYC